MGESAMRQRFAAAATACVVGTTAIVLAAGPAAASDEVACATSVVATEVTPGALLFTRRDVEVTGSGIELLCSGTVDGQVVANLATGTLEIDIEVDDVRCVDLLGGVETSGAYELTVPVVGGGTRTVEGTFDLEVTLTIAIFSNGIESIGTFQPTAGACVLIPIEAGIAELVLPTFTD
jgi:hypothetical protein